MNTSTKLIACMAFVSTTFALAGCGDGGSKFVGTWNCGSGITLAILHISGNKYSVEGNHSGVPVVMPYKDGGLVNAGGKATIDEKTGVLVSEGFACQKTKSRSGKRSGPVISPVASVPRL